MELKIRQNSPINQTTFHMLREVKQVQKLQKFPDPTVDFRDMATNNKG